MKSDFQQDTHKRDNQASICHQMDDKQIISSARGSSSSNSSAQHPHYSYSLSTSAFALVLGRKLTDAAQLTLCAKSSNNPSTQQPRRSQQQPQKCPLVKDAIRMGATEPQAVKLANQLTTSNQISRHNALHQQQRPQHKQATSYPVNKWRRAPRGCVFPSFNFSPLLFALALLLATMQTGGAQESATSASQASSQQAPAMGNRQLERVDKLSDSTTEDNQKTIVASLSSAVASAAVAAAVAAAQGSLSGGDGRSGVLGSVGPNSSASHQSRSSNLAHLAIHKIADAIPEVPYNILHNMKKLDHAAPFYNVPNKLHSPGHGGKESSGSSFASSLLASALHSVTSHASLSPGIVSHGGVGPVSPTESLTALFRSPLWKRIADGYGEFTSEFRSLFRAQQPTPMKGSTSSATTKFLRDISVPAILMLIASAMPSDWRPSGRNRRKSPSIAAELASNLDTLAISASSPLAVAAEQPSFTLSPQQALYKHANNNQHSLNQSPANQVSWYSNPEHLVNSYENAFSLQNGRSIPLMANQRLPVLMPAAAQEQQSAVAMRRSGEMFATEKSLGRSTSSGRPSAASSLTLKGSSFINRLTNANGNANGKQHGAELLSAGNMRKLVANLIPSRNTKIVSLERREQLIGDKHRYSLVEDSGVSASKGAIQPTGGQLQKPFLLSAMTHAFGSMLPSLESGYHFGDAADKTINQKDQMMRRQTHSTQTLQSGNFGVEQRDLSKLLPQSWKDVVKRTVTNVQQTASTQWKSIEGQLTNWVQDKLRSLPLAAPPAGGSTSSSSSSASNAVAAPVSNLIASVSSTAMNILGLGGSNKSSVQHSSSNSEPSTSASSSASASSPVAESNSQRGNKHESPSGSNRNSTPAASGPKATLVGMADMIVNTLTNRQPASSQSTTVSTSSSASSATSSYPVETSASSVAPKVVN